MNENIGVWFVLILIDVILLIRIIRLYVNTEVVKVKLIRNYTRRTSEDDYVNQQWEGLTRDGNKISGWYTINSDKKIELKEDGIYKKIIYDKNEKKFITTPFKRLLVDSVFVYFLLLTFLGNNNDYIEMKIITLFLLLISGLSYSYFRIKPKVEKVEAKRKKIKKKSKILNYLLPWIVILGIIIIIAIPIFKQNQINEFTEEDWNYIYEYIDIEFGNGEHFNIISEETENIEKYLGTKSYSDGSVSYKYETLGIKVTFIGYFDSQEQLYAITFSKYVEDNPLFKDGKAGNVILTSVNTNYSKDEYFKEVNNND